MNDDKQITRNFGNMLAHYVPRTHYMKVESPVILNVGCGGDCLEAEVLTEFFNGDLLGIDIIGV